MVPCCGSRRGGRRRKRESVVSEIQGEGWRDEVRRTAARRNIGTSERRRIPWAVDFDIVQRRFDA